jgi:general secretion pathway protein D
MRARSLAAGLAVIALLLTCGCAQKEAVKTSANLAEINQQIIKGKGRPEGAVPTEGALSEPGPRVKDLSVEKDGRNPELRRLKPKRPAKKAKTKEGILLNFDNADIYEVIRVVGETLDLNYIVDPQVKGVVNIRTSKPIPRDELLAVFRKILNINGLDIISEGDHYYIYPTPNPAVQKVNGPNQIGKLRNSSKMVMQIIPLMYLSSTEGLDLINPYLSAQGLTYNLADQNMIIISDYESMVVDIVRILSYLDVSPLTDFHMRLVRVENAALYDLNDELTEILTAMRVNKKEKGSDNITILPIEQVNSLLLVSKSDFLLDNVQKWIEDLDIVPSRGQDNIFLYNVRNTVASELAELVNKTLGEEAGKTTGKKLTPGAPQVVGRPSQPAKGAERKPPSVQKLAGGPLLIADDTRNIILIRALPADYRRIVKLLERLDNLPRQVLIEVMVADVSLTDDLQYGVEWAIQDNNLTLNGNQYDQNFRSTNLNMLTDPTKLSGFTYSILSSEGDVRALLQALATDTNVTILSSPQILVLNGESATINVGNSVAIPTSQITSAESATSANQTTLATSIQYKDTGVILNVTPTINFNGIITLQVDQQVSNVGAVGVGGAPDIFNRQLKTKLAIKDGQSIMIGGLISKDNNISETGIPLLKDIPLLGWLFKSHTKTSTRNELLVMITPYVIETEDVLQQYFKTFNKKMSELRRQLGESGKGGPEVQPR